MTNIVTNLKDKKRETEREREREEGMRAIGKKEGERRVIPRVKVS